MMNFRMKFILMTLQHVIVFEKNPEGSMAEENNSVDEILKEIL